MKMMQKHLLAIGLTFALILIWSVSNSQTINTTLQDKNSTLGSCFNILDRTGSVIKFDSCIIETIGAVEANYDLQQSLLLKTEYLANIEKTYQLNSTTLKYLSELNDYILSNTLLDDNPLALFSLSNGYYCVDDLDKAIDVGIKSLNLAKEQNNAHYQLSCHLLLLKIYIEKEDIINTYQQLLDAKYIMNTQITPDYDLEYQILKSELVIYEYLRNEMEIFNCLKRIDDLVASSQPIDSLMLIKNRIDYTYYYVIFDKDIPINIKDLLDYTKRHQKIKLQNHLLGIYRTYLLNSNKYDELFDFYVNSYPDLLKHESQLNACRFCTLKAYIYEYEGKLDSAHLAFTNAEEELNRSQNSLFYTINFYRRKGEFLIRNNEYNSGINYLERAFSMVDSIAFNKFSEPICGQLVKIHESMGNIEKSNYYLKKYMAIKLSIADRRNSEELQKMKIEYQNKEQNYLLEQENQRQKSQQNAKFFFIAALIAFSIVLFAIISSFRIPEWVVEMQGFFVVLFLFEFIILILDYFLHNQLHGDPLKTFGAKVFVISFLYPLHHLIEKKSIEYMKANNMINTSSFSKIKELLKLLWPWLKK